MIIRILVAVLVSVVIGALSLFAWQALLKNETDQIARVAESESYAARSRLVRDVDALLQSLRNIAGSWSAFGLMPDEWWVADERIDPVELPGVTALLWQDTENNLRFLRNAEHPGFSYRPGNDEWSPYARVVERAQSVEQETMLGPGSTRSANELEVIIPDPSGNARLIAIIDANAMLGQFLMDSSPGYAVSVHWNETELYARGNVEDTPEMMWRRDGLIRNSIGIIWHVEQGPTPELARSMQTQTITAVPVTGIVIAVLLGLLIFENGRAGDRAASAEKAEHMLADLNRNLERQIAERTQELQERSSDLLTIADSVGHDLRNPLSSISMNAQLLQQKYKQELSRNGDEKLTGINSGVKRMSEILDRLLGLSILSNSTFNPETLDIAELARNIFEELQSSDENLQARLEVAELPPACADPTLTRTLLGNLLSNALKYSRNGDTSRIKIDFLVRNEVPVYYVRDNGVGFDDAASEQLFEAFERLSHGNEIEGLGLGLHIAARVVKRHGGQIWAESNADSGATFFFSLQPPKRPTIDDLHSPQLHKPL